MEEETAKMEKHLSSAAAFVEGGIQDSCDDACSICLEEFCESDPSTVCGSVDLSAVMIVLRFLSIDLTNFLIVLHLMLLV